MIGYSQQICIAATGIFTLELARHETCAFWFLRQNFEKFLARHKIMHSTLVLSKKIRSFSKTLNEENLMGFPNYWGKIVSFNNFYACDYSHVCKWIFNFEVPFMFTLISAETLTKEVKCPKGKQKCQFYAETGTFLGKNKT